MKKNKDKRKNETPDVETPRPPQVMDASRPPQQEKDNEVEKEAARDTKGKDSKKKDEKKKLLGESPIEIDDETTI